MFLAILGALTITTLLYLILTKKTSAVVALILVPVFYALIGGYGTEIISFMSKGLLSIAPTAVMFVFAILFFGVLTDAGTFKPIIRFLLKKAGSDPSKIAVATALLAMIVHLDGSGSVTFLVCIPALLPIYDALGMKRLTLATIVALAAGTMNILPWGGPTIRAASALNIPVTELFAPMLIPVLVGLTTVLFISYRLGKKEVVLNVNPIVMDTSEVLDNSERPKLFWINLLLIVAAIGCLLSGIAPAQIIFIVAFAIAVTINYPKVKEQTERINSHAKAALLMASILFAAGCFTGILKESGMITAMGTLSTSLIPSWIGSHLAVITGVFAMPASLLFDPDSYYFGILPLVSDIAAIHGIDPIAIGRAAITGQMTTGFPVSPLTGATYLLIGLTGVSLGDHQKMCIPYAFLISIIILITAIIVGAIPF